MKKSRMHKAQHFIELVFVQTKATIKAEAKSTYIGYLWWLLDPFMFITVYYFVFAKILNNKTEDYVIFLILGILSFRWFQSSITQGASMIQNSGGLIKRISLPKPLFVVTKLFHNFWQFIFVFIVYNTVILFFGATPSIHIAAIPFIMFAQLFCIFSISILLASIYPFFPDIKHVINPILQALLFLSGVFFPSDKVPEDLKFYFYLNPMANFIDAYRASILYHEWPDFLSLVKILLISMIVACVGLALVKKLDSDYAKVIP